MTTDTLIFQRSNGEGPFGNSLEDPGEFHKRITRSIRSREELGWQVRQIVQVQDHHAFFVVFERTERP